MNFAIHPHQLTNNKMNLKSNINRNNNTIIMENLSHVGRPVSVSVLMYYDEYERYDGDGFYPIILKPNDSDNVKYAKYKKVTIQFEYNYTNRRWKQSTEERITGLDGEYGTELLNRLNKEGNVNGLTIYSYCQKTRCGFLLLTRPLNL